MSLKKIINIPDLKSNNFVSLIQNKDFLYLWLSQALSVFCAQVLNFVIAYQIFKITGSSFYVSLIFLFFLMPVFMLGLFAGIIVDHFSRRNIMAVTNILQALIVILYLFVDKNWGIYYVIIFIYSFTDEFYYPAESALMPTIVEKKLLPTANFLFTLASYGAIVVGFSFAGIIIRLFGLPMTFILASVLLFIAFLASFSIKKDTVPRKISDFEKEPFQKMWREIKNNYRFILKNKLIYFPIAIMLVFQMTVGILGVSLPELGTKILNINFLDLGYKLILPVFLGSLIGTYVVEKLIVGNKKDLVVGGFFGVSIGILALGFVAYFNILFYPLLFLIAVFIGFSAMVILITSQTLLQEETPQENMGRVSGAFKFIQSFISLIPILFSGGLIDWFGVLPVVFGISFAGFLMGIFGFFYRRKDLRIKEKTS